MPIRAGVVNAIRARTRAQIEITQIIRPRTHRTRGGPVEGARGTGDPPELGRRAGRSRIGDLVRSASVRRISRSVPRPGSCNFDLPLRRAEPLLITPRLHRVPPRPRRINRNLGTVLSICDRVAGTVVVADTAAPGPTGLPGERDSYRQRFLTQCANRSVNSGPGLGPGPGSSSTSSCQRFRRRSVGGRRGSPEDVFPASGEDVECEGGSVCYQYSGEVAGGSGGVDNGVVGKLDRPGGAEHRLGRPQGGDGCWAGAMQVAQPA
jgi:hypothetical protein